MGKGQFVRSILMCINTKHTFEHMLLTHVVSLKGVRGALSGWDFHHGIRGT